MNLWQRNRDRRRRRILAAARRLILEGGVERVSMRRLAEAAEVSVATLYSLYGSKDGVLVAVMADLLDAVEARLTQIPASAPLTRARTIITASVDHFAADRDLYRRVLAGGYRRELRRVSGLEARAAAMQEAAVATAIREGLLRDDLPAGELGRQIFRGYEAAMLEWALGCGDDARFRREALYGLYICLLAVAAEQTRKQILDELRALAHERAAAETPAPAQGAG